MEPFVQKQYDDYQANYVEKEVMAKYDLRQKIIDDLSYCLVYTSDAADE